MQRAFVTSTIPQRILLSLEVIRQLRTRRTITNQYGEVNSVKNTTINIWLNDGVY